MFFALTFLTKDDQWRNFSFRPSSLEVGMDMVTRLLGVNKQLLNVDLLDGSSRTPLPIEAFDGSALGGPMNQLQQEWQQLLVILTSPQAVNTDRDTLLQRLVETRQKRIDDLRLTRGRMRQLIDRATGNLTTSDQNAALLRHYEKIITYCDFYLTRLDAKLD